MNNQKRTQKIFFQKLMDSATIPLRSTLRSAGFDLFTPDDICLPGGKTCLIDTGIKAEFPRNHYGLIAGLPYM